MKQSILYCHKRKSTRNRELCGDFWYNDCDLHPKTTELYEGGIPVHKVRVRELENKETSPYWAWWDAKDNRFTMMHYHRDILEMCFPYGLEAEAESGKGNDYNVMTEDLGIVTKEEMESI